MIAPADIRSLFPEFTAQTDQRLNTFIGYAYDRIDASIFASRADEAASWLTAHLLAKAAQAARLASGAGGLVTQQKVGELSTSYASYGLLIGSGADYASTPYGAQFESIVELCLPTPWVSA